MYSRRRLLEFGAAGVLGWNIDHGLLGGNRRHRSVTVKPPPARARTVPLNVTISPAPAPGGGGTGDPGWPASYYTGPLGANNVVPSTLTGALLGFWPDDVRGLTSTQKRQIVTDRMAACGGRSFDIVGMFYSGTTPPGTANSGTYGTGGEAWVHSLGSIPAINWNVSRLTKGASNDNTMVEINNGLHDSRFTSAANFLIPLGFRVMWRLFYEFDGNWYPWSPTANASSNDGFPNPGCTPTQWVTAWRRIVGIFQSRASALGLPLNVGFWYCPTESNANGLANSCDPGDAWFDWAGSDVYNHADQNIFTTPLHAGWAEFWELFNYTGHGSTKTSQHDTFGPRKPFVVGETGSLYTASDINRKANWFRNVYANAFGKPDMPYLCGIQYFDQNLAPNVEDFDWRVDSNQTWAMASGTTATPGTSDAVTYQGFKDLSGRPEWNVGAVGGAT